MLKPWWLLTTKDSQVLVALFGMLQAKTDHPSFTCVKLQIS